jgi:hypothetical protein
VSFGLCLAGSPICAFCRRAKSHRRLFLAILTGFRRAPIIDARSETWRFLIADSAVSDIRFFGRNPVETTIGYIRERYIESRVHRNARRGTAFVAKFATSRIFSWGAKRKSSKNAKRAARPRITSEHPIEY